MKPLIIICIILLAANAYLIWDNVTLNRSLSKQEEENKALSVYIDTLTEKLSHYEADHSEDIEIPKTMEIRKLLESYLRDRDEGESDHHSSISTEELQKELEDYQFQQRFIPNRSPVTGDYQISQFFTEQHKGIDIAAPLGTEVIASGAGVVKSVYEDKFFGKVTVIDHLNHYLTFYAHLAKTFYEPGYFIEKGQTIGLVGSSGFSTGPHLHFEVIYRGNNIDPTSLIY